MSWPHFFLSCRRYRRLDRVPVRYHRISVAQKDLYVFQERFSVVFCVDTALHDLNPGT